MEVTGNTLSENGRYDIPLRAAIFQMLKVYKWHFFETGNIGHLKIPRALIS